MKDPWMGDENEYRYKYNGIEEVDDFGLDLSFATFRTLDLSIGRWLQVDPKGEGAYGHSPYNSMFNNPISNVDPEGDFAWGVVALYAAVNVGINAAQGNINNVGDFLTHAAVGAANGALAQIPGLQVPFGDSGFGLSLAPQIAVGTDGVGLGFNANLGYQGAKGLNAGINLGGSFNTSAPGTGQSGFEGRLGYGLGYKRDGFQVGIGSTFFASGGTSQLSGQLYAGVGKYKLTYENDTWAPVPGLFVPGGRERDRYRTAALQFDINGGKLKGAKAGLRIFTGLATGVDRTAGPNGTFIGGDADNFRLGAAFVGYKNLRLGYNSERNIRGPIQNGFHDWRQFPRFEVLNNADRFYGGFYSSNPYTLWP